MLSAVNVNRLSDCVRTGFGRSTVGGTTRTVPATRSTCRPTRTWATGTTALTWRYVCVENVEIVCKVCEQ